MRRAILPAAILAMLLPVASSAQKAKKTPYWASISAGEALMRTGPGKNYPATWFYRRADLPIRVRDVYKIWRKIEDPGGTTGWMQVTLLSDTRTALVTGDAPRPIHDQPGEASPVRYNAQPGVVGRISECAAGWCRIDVRGQVGYISAGHFWGIDKGETVE